jgi:hypothetical protein
MAFHRKNVFAALLLWFLPLMGRAAEEAPVKPEVKQRLELLKAGFDSYVLKTVTIPFEEGLAKLGDQAVPALKRESAAAAERKDLDALVRIKSDLERLGKGEVLTGADVPAPPAALATVYAAYKLEHLKLQTARETAFADARQRYDKGLAAVQDELTAQQDVEGAVYVKVLRTDLAGAVAGAAASRTSKAPGAAPAPAAVPGSSGAVPAPREWTYHTGENVGSVATMAFEPDGTFLMPWKNLKVPHAGTWKATPKPGVFTLIYSNVPDLIGKPVELTITGDKAQMDMPDVGMRYLRAKPLDDSSKIAGLWTCHLTRDGVPHGLLTLHPDSRLMLKMKQEKEAWTGSWNDTDKAGIIHLSFENHPKAGTTAFDATFSGDTGEMDLPNGAGKLYLKFQSGMPTVAARKVPDSMPKVDGLPAEWSYHVRMDWYSIAWLRLLPTGLMEWHDRKGMQTCQWRRTKEGFEVDYPNEKPWIVKTSNATAADVDRSPGGPSNDHLFVKAPLDGE